jgi:hypothetical protein
MLDKESIIYRQKQWEKRWAREREELALEEAARVAKMEAESRKQEEIAARKKLLLEQQEAERLRQKHIQRKEKIAEQKWNKQFDTLLAQIKDRAQKNDKLEEIRIIIQNREPSFEELDWASWISNPLNQKLADLDIERAMEMFKRDNLMAKRRRPSRGTRKEYNYVLSFTGDTAADAAEDHVTTTFDPQTYNLNSGFTISFWVRPDEIPVATHLFALGKRNANAKERFTFGLQNASKLYLGVGKQKKTSTNHGMSVDNWYHWVVTFAGGTGGALIAYRDGEDIDLASDGNGTSTWVDTDSDEPIFFGGRNLIGSYNNGWACALDEVAIFNEVKDSDWVADTYNNGTPVDLQGQSGLVGYWKFNKGTGTTVKDYSGNDNHGTFAAISGDTTAYPTWEKVKI